LRKIIDVTERSKSTSSKGLESVKPYDLTLCSERLKGIAGDGSRFKFILINLLFER